MTSPKLRFFIGSISILLLIFASSVYFNYKKQHPQTNNAYLAGFSVPISSKVTGEIKQIAIHNNQRVHKGQPLLQIDKESYLIAKRDAEAQLELARQAMRTQKAQVDVAQADYQCADAQLNAQKKYWQRLQKLAKQQQIAAETLDRQHGKLLALAAQQNAAQHRLSLAKQQLGHTGEDNARVRSAIAECQKAQLNLDYTTITAPCDGYISQCKLHTGHLVSPGQPLFYVITHHKWIDANFKETQLPNIRLGQPVRIKIDMYPKQTFTGKVDSISHGSGTLFSLLPPENATGNWVKITQRFPVKIILDSTEQPLRLGASAQVTIDTTRHS